MMNKYNVFEYMKTYYETCGEVPDTSDLVQQFPRLGLIEIMTGERMFTEWMGDVSA